MDQWFKNIYTYIRLILDKNKLNIALITATLMFVGAAMFSDYSNAEKPAAVSTTVPSTTSSTTSTTTTTVEATTTTVEQTTTTRALLPHEIYPKIDGIKWNEYSCSEWFDTAIQVGWPVEQWPTLSMIMFRESRCHPDAWNRADPTADGSRGLTQINGVWCEVNSNNPTGWLQRQFILTTCEDLFNPTISLRATLALWNYSGWHPWGL